MCIIGQDDIKTPGLEIMLINICFSCAGCAEQAKIFDFGVVSANEIDGFCDHINQFDF